MEHTHIAKDGTVYTHTHEEAHEHGHSHSHPHHHESTKAVLNRMNRAIGHMEAVKTMIEDGRDCSEVLIQIAAVRSAINNIGKIILEDHINHCLVDAIETGDEQVLKDLNEASKLRHLLLVRPRPAAFGAVVLAWLRSGCRFR